MTAAASILWKQGTVEDSLRCSNCGGWGHEKSAHIDIIYADWDRPTDLKDLIRKQQHVREFPVIAEGGSSRWRLHIFEYLGSIDIMESSKSFLQQTVEQIATLQRSRRERQLEPRPFSCSDRVVIAELLDVTPTSYDGPADVIANDVDLTAA